MMNRPASYFQRFFPEGSALLAALTVFVIYLLTADSGVSYWDCPEYVLTASGLQIGHPPGNPVWTLAMRVATIPFAPEMHARVINICSAALMALAVFFLARVTYELILYVIRRLPDSPRILSHETLRIWSAGGAAAAALTFGVLDSTWYSAVEAEVYAFSTFLTIFTVWLMFRWAREESAGGRQRLLILIAYVLGLSLGVHQLNLLVVPALALIFVFRRNPERKATAKAWWAIAVSFALVAVVLLGFMPGTVACAAHLELLAVNKLHLPYFSGVWIYLLLTFSLFALALFIASRLKGRWSGAVTAVWMAGMLWVGYSAVALLLIRGYAAPPVNEASPSDIFALQRYIAREQYGSKPLFYGATPFSRPMLKETFRPGETIPDYSRYALIKENGRYVPTLAEERLVYRSGLLSRDDSTANKDVAERGHGYLLSDYSFSRRTTPELSMFFPRITASTPAMLDSYEDWAGMNRENMERVEITTAIDSTGKAVGRLGAEGERRVETGLRPTYLQNLRFFISYQVGYMYLRYLLWNFVGRQNDIPSTGEIDHGNVITGIGPLDSLMVGDQSLMPRSATYDNPGRHVYYAIPLIVGVLGILFLWNEGRAGKRTLALVTILFLMTGLAIVVYLNQTPGEPRERDYAFIGSYMSFCIWIGFGLIFLGMSAATICRSTKWGGSTLAIAATGLVALLAAENYPDHDRSGRYHTRAFALNMLAGKERDIIISYGDNFSFPLWYAQEVEKAAPEATLIDASYLATPEYVVNLLKQGKKGLKLTATPADIIYGAYAFTRVAADADTVARPLIDILRELYASTDGSPVIHHTKALLPGKTMADTITINLRSLATTSGMIPFRTLMTLDLIATNLEEASPRAVSFLTPVKREVYAPVKDALLTEAFSNTYAPAMTREEYLDRLLKSARAVDSTARAHATDRPYIDPVIDDQVRRQRGGLARAAAQLREAGDSATARALLLRFPQLFPTTSPGSFTVADSTFHETLEAASMLIDEGDMQSVRSADSLLRRALPDAEAWHRYYFSLPAWRRGTVSNGSRILINTRTRTDSMRRLTGKILNDNR